MGYRKEQTFGLDIGDRSLKVLQLGTSKGKTQVIAFSELELPSGLLEHGDILKPDELAGHIKQVLKKAHIVAEHVAAALPEAKTFLKILTFPSAAATTLRPIVETELQKHLPYELQEVWWDFVPVTSSDTNVQVLVGATPKAVTAAYSSLLEKAGLIPAILDLEPLSIARATVKENASVGCTFIADIGATKTTLILATERTVLSTADGRSGADELTEKLTEALKIEHGAAEEMKRKYGLKEGSEKYSSVTEAYVSQLVKRIKEVMSFALSHEGLCPAVNEIMLSGGGALLKGLPEYISSHLKIAARIADPWINVEANGEFKITKEASVRLATVCGLAIAAFTSDHTR